MSTKSERVKAIMDEIPPDPHRSEIPNPPCTTCDQRERHCKGLQLKRAAKACHLLMSHIVGYGQDGTIAYDVAKVLQPAWYTSKRNSETRLHDISRRVFRDLTTAERRCLRETGGNATWNRERKRKVMRRLSKI